MWKTARLFAYGAMVIRAPVFESPRVSWRLG